MEPQAPSLHSKSMLDVPVLHIQSESYDGSVHSSFMSIICFTVNMQYKLALLVFVQFPQQLFAFRT
jgi:hypothetical protein